MSHPLEAFEIELPSGVDKAVLSSLEHAVAQTSGVDQCGQGTVRSLDPATLTMWVTLAATTITTLGTAVPVVKQIIDLFKRKGIKGAKLVLANGTVLEADEITAKDLLELAKKP